MQLIAGLEFNSKNGKKGAFREDRYDATAVETSGHLKFPGFTPALMASEKSTSLPPWK